MNQTLKKIKNLFVLKPVTKEGSLSVYRESNLESISLRCAISQEKVAQRAFMIWQERGCTHGNDREDWLLAQVQLEDELSVNN